jgi:3-hydroxyacyl-CoA dehydrogenase
MLARHGDALPAFELIIAAKKAGSAQEARAMKVLRDADAISMNRARVLADAKTRCLVLAKGYKAASPAPVNTGGAAAKNAILHRLEALAAENKASPHDLVIGRVLAHVLSGGEVAGSVSEEQLMALEHDGFMELIRTDASQARIAQMLEAGKPLKN